MSNIIFTPAGQKDLQKLPSDLQKRIIKKLKFFAVSEKPLYFSKPLIKLPPSTHRFRVGDYRIAFFLVGKTLYIDRIRHRKEIYLS